jgi:diguanylate cyclase
MASERQHQRARELAAAALAELAARSLAPTPEHFRIWYVHLSGEDAVLSRALTQAVQEGERLDEGRCTEIYKRFFVRAAEERTLLNAGKRLNELASELVGEVAGFGGETARFGSSLSAAREQIGQPPTSERICSIVRGMVEETRRMQDQAQQVESSLRANMAQIDHLRRDLQIAWSEARTDGLTGAANRKHFDQALRLAAAQALEHNVPFCLLLADIDHFKRFNDVYGHVLGDQVLRLVASLLKHNVEGQDLVARYGGEEFAVILPTTRLADAATLADRLRELVATRRIQLKERGRTLDRVTLPIGVAEFHHGERCADWIGRADEALYQAKHDGRKGVAIARTPEEAAPAEPMRLAACG